MSICIAITKKGHRCSYKKVIDGLCGLHHKYNPSLAVIENHNHPLQNQKIIPYITKENYLAMLDKHIKEEEQERIQQAEQAELERIKQEEKDKASQLSYLTIKTCLVCNEEFQSHDLLIPCSKSNFKHPHLVCSNCLYGHTLSLLNDGIASLECMFHKHDNCGGQYTEIDIINSSSSSNKEGEATAKLESDFDITKWQELLSKSEIIKIASIFDNYVICPFCCNWGCIFEPPNGYENLPFEITCNNNKCSKKWCTKCKRTSHPDKTCYQIIFTDEEQNITVREQIIDKMIIDIATNTMTHNCSNCGTKYIKEEGCNLMTCSKCGGMSCFICGIKLYYKGNNKYWHFIGYEHSDKNATCPLWNNYAGDGKEKQGNTEYNARKLLLEFTSFLNSNNTTPNTEYNKYMEKLIYTRLAKFCITNQELIPIFQQICNK